MSVLFPARPASRPRASSRRAFTLIELLTVIAIIGVLAAILIPTVGAVRAQARQAQSISNLRQVGVAMLAYTADHKGRFPLSTHSHGEEDSWINSLLPYVGGSDQVRVCPLDPRKELLIERRLSSYTLNEWLLPLDNGDGLVTDRRFSEIHRIPDPSRAFVVFLGCEDKRHPNITHDHTHSVGWNHWSRVTADIDPDRFRSGSTRSADRATGSSPYVFADGHVNVIPAARLRAALATANFAKPGNW